MATGKDDIPQDVLDEVNKIREEDGGDPVVVGEEESERAPLPRPSRRAAKEHEREEREAKLLEAAEEARKTAEEAREEARKERAADREKMARLEALLEAQVMGQRSQVQEPAPKVEDNEDWRDKHAAHMRDAKAALAKGELDEYEAARDRAADVKLNARLAQERQKQQPQVQPQRQFQKPEWVAAVESQFADVMMHPSGTNTVAAFAQMDPGPLTPEKLQKAFTRSRKELGLAPKEEDIEAKKQMLSGGRVNGTSKGSSNGGKGELMVNLPRNWRAIAKQSGVPEKEYVRQYAAANPGDVTRE